MLVQRGIPSEVEERLKRGKMEMRKLSQRRRLCQLFLKGETYYYVSKGGGLASQTTALGADSDKPGHRIRNRYNFIRPLVDGKVSSSTTRPPGYEVNPTGTAPETIAAAHLSEKILRQGYRTWYLREARVKAATLAIGGGGVAYALPYFDPQVGPFHRLDSGEAVGEGEIKVMVLSGNEVFYEPGEDFYHSRWYGVETAWPESRVKGLKDYIPGPLRSDATLSDTPTKAPETGMVMVTMYFERPCQEYPQGRMLMFANGRQITPDAPYPMRRKDKTIDTPCLHRLEYRIDPSDDDDLGLTWELIDFQRTVNDCYNKMVELKNRALNLRMMAPEGSVVTPPGDAPGGIDYYRVIGGQKPEWERAPDPNIMGQLMQMLSRAVEDMRFVAADADINAAPNIAAGALQTVAQQANNRWSSYLGALARWDSEVASHCLLLAQNHYNEKRVLKIKGRYGWEPNTSFFGAEILDQTDVAVNPATIETHSRQAILQQLGWIQANFPGFVRPEVAIEIAMTGVSPESVIESFEYDKQRINNVVQRIREGTIFEMGTRIDTDAATGQPAEVPAWMPRAFDNVAVQLWVFENWLKSDDASRLPPEMYEAANLIHQGLKMLQAKQEAEAAAAQQMQAEELGATNAAKPQEAKPMPSTPNPAGEAPTDGV